MTLTELDTPTLILDEDRMQRNINRMAERIDALGIRLRPHVKTCKSIDVTKRVLGEEGDGITVSTLKEAEYFADAGYRDIFYAVSLAPGRVPRAAKLILRGVSLMSECHDLEAARMLEGACENVGIVMPLVVEVNVDGHRCGVPPEDDRLLHVARFIHASPHLEMRGIMAYGGGSYDCETTDAMAALAEQIREGAIAVRDQFERDGIPCPVVSYGSSPGTFFARHLEGITESRAGVYVFQDAFQAGIGACEVDDIAVSVLTTVLAHEPQRNAIMIDAGGLAMSKDRSTEGRTFDAGYGWVSDVDGNVIEDLYVSETSQELGFVTTRDNTPLDMSRFPAGTRLRILPNHVCMTAAAYEGYHVVDGSSPEVTAWWPRVNGW